MTEPVFYQSPFLQILQWIQASPVPPSCSSSTSLQRLLSADFLLPSTLHSSTPWTAHSERGEGRPLHAPIVAKENGAATELNRPAHCVVSRTSTASTPTLIRGADVGASIIPDRLARLETTLADHARALESLREQTSTPLRTDEPSLTGNEAAYPAAMPPIVDTQTPVDYLAPMTIPIRHATTTGNLLQTRPITALIGDYPTDLFLRIEQKRPLPLELSLSAAFEELPVPSLDPALTTPLADHYFDAVHLRHPIIGKYDWAVDCTLLDMGISDWNYRLAKVFMVLAVAQVDRDLRTAEPNQLPGIQCLRPALQYILRTLPNLYQTDIDLSQALYLAALYYSYLCRLLQAWRLIHMASTNIQHEIHQLSNPRATNVLQTCWALFLMECDLVSEYHLPWSGIETLVDQLPYPDCGPTPPPYESAWLANISARKLLNRIHCTIYASNAIHWDGQTYESLSRPLHALSDELSHQLQTWWEFVPPSVKPDLDDDHPSPDAAILLLRYHACGDIITRPFLHQVCSRELGVEPPREILIQAQDCISHCRAFLRIVPTVLSRPIASAVIYLHS
ncbi:fungal specific transcription factor domain-containing protein [Aspergillus stella-maris]|uniref:fungal specific transcription factor domain-containing protein n=1 Tax=Aspergillus stella-maris TaxID=1810926 RepID=UPI003CCD650C